MSASVNQNYLKLNESYLFAEIARRIREWQSAHPELSSQLIRMGIGDVILAESTLSFLGLGIKYPAASWGSS